MRTDKIAGRAYLLIVMALCLSNSALADVKLPALFSNHAVLQQDAIVPVWGWAKPGEEVTVSIAGQTRTTKAGENGKWIVKLDKMKSGGPFKLSVKGENTITVDDVLVGEVWLGSGQSNMAMAVGGSKDFENEKTRASLPDIRMFTVASGNSTKAEEDCKGAWVVCSPDTVGSFSATLFFFGREIHKALGCPTGLINSSVGGTPIEFWISTDAQKESPELASSVSTAESADRKNDTVTANAKHQKDLEKWKKACEAAKKENKPLPKRPENPAAKKARRGSVGGLFNGKIAPLIPYAIRGAVWYQGEANRHKDKCMLYQHQLPLLVKDWRTRWGYDFPFAWVQLPNFKTDGDGWMLVREAMLNSLKVPNTGMAITIDVGDPADIHPKNKQEVGRRLSLWALGTVYGQKTATSGPLPAGHKINGNEIICSFTHCDGGLVAKGSELKGFVITGADKKWVPANAKIAGENVVVSSPDVKEPVAVRYAWADNPACSLYNGAGLPASPFRTDNETKAKNK